MTFRLIELSLPRNFLPIWQFHRRKSHCSNIHLCMLLCMTDSKKEVKDGAASEVSDGVADTSVGIAKTAEEIAMAPVRVAGRIIDGVAQGVKDGLEQSNNPMEGVAKSVAGAVMGGTKGAVSGVHTAVKNIGTGVQDVAKGVAKIGDTLAGEKIRSLHEHRARNDMEQN